MKRAHQVRGITMRESPQACPVRLGDLGPLLDGVVRLLVIMIVSKSELERRNRERNLVGAADAYDQAWETPLTRMPVMKFRNESQSSFDTSYYLLTELLKSNVSPYRRRFMEHMFPGT